MVFVCVRLSFWAQDFEPWICLVSLAIVYSFLLDLDLAAIVIKVSTESVPYTLEITKGSNIAELNIFDSTLLIPSTGRLAVIQ